MGLFCHQDMGAKVITLICKGMTATASSKLCQLFQFVAEMVRCEIFYLVTKEVNWNQKIQCSQGKVFFKFVLILKKCK